MSFAERPSSGRARLSRARGGGKMIALGAAKARKSLRYNALLAEREGLEQAPSEDFSWAADKVQM